MPDNTKVISKWFHYERPRCLDNFPKYFKAQLYKILISELKIEQQVHSLLETSLTGEVKSCWIMEKITVQTEKYGKIQVNDKIEWRTNKSEKLPETQSCHTHKKHQSSGLCNLRLARSQAGDNISQHFTQEKTSCEDTGVMNELRTRHLDLCCWTEMLSISD